MEEHQPVTELSEGLPPMSAWMQRLGTEVARLEEFFPKWPILDDGTPDWVKRVEREVASALFPVAKDIELDGFTPRRMGLLLGQNCANAVWLMEWFAEKRREEEARTTTGGGNPASGESPVLDGRLQAQADRDVMLIVTKWYPGMRRLAKLSLCSAVDRTYEEMSEFLLGFADGFGRKPGRMGFSEFGSSALEIYVLLLMTWKLVTRFGSVRELHAFLVKVLGSHRTGDLKRLEKICQRMGLSYRKPGRPRKAPEIQTP